MPFVYAHYECGARTLATLGGVRNLLDEHRAYFDWGCQGPDPWFFHRLPPVKLGKSHRGFGSLLHKERVDVSMAAFAAAAARDSRVFAYFAGYLCHYALDGAAHPYIYYRTTMKEHTLLEADIDAVLLDQKGASPATDPLPGKLPPIDDGVFEAFFRPAAEALGYPMPPAAYRQCARDMRATMRAIYDPRGKKRPLVVAIESVLGIRGLASRAFIRPPIAEWDSHNRKRRPWQQPWDGAWRSESFDDMLNAAVDQAFSHITLLHEAVSGRFPMDVAVAAIGDRSFASGISCYETPPFTHLATSLTDMTPRAHVPERTGSEGEDGNDKTA